MKHNLGKRDLFQEALDNQEDVEYDKSLEDRYENYKKFKTKIYNIIEFDTHHIELDNIRFIDYLKLHELEQTKLGIIELTNRVIDLLNKD